MTNIQTKKILSAIVIYHMWRNDAFHFWRHHWLTKTITMKTTLPIKQTTYTWRITFLVYLPTATPDWMCCSPIHQNTKSDTGLIRKLRLKHPHTTHMEFDPLPHPTQNLTHTGLIRKSRLKHPHTKHIGRALIAKPFWPDACALGHAWGRPNKPKCAWCIRIIVRQKQTKIWHAHWTHS